MERFRAMQARRAGIRQLHERSIRRFDRDLENFGPAKEREVARGRSHVQVLQLCRGPVRGQLRVYCDRVGAPIQLQAKEAAQNGRDDHGRRPELMAGASSEWLEESTGEEFGDGAGVLRRCLVCILAKVRVAGERAVAAVIGERGPACEERPDRTLVVAHRVVHRVAFGHIPGAPVGREVV